MMWETNFLLISLAVIIMQFIPIHGYAKLGETMNCANGDCSETISEGKAKLAYQPRDGKFLNLKKGDVVIVKGKKAGQKTDLWGGEEFSGKSNNEEEASTLSYINQKIKIQRKLKEEKSQDSKTENSLDSSTSLQAEPATNIVVKLPDDDVDSTNTKANAKSDNSDAAVIPSVSNGIVSVSKDDEEIMINDVKDSMSRSETSLETESAIVVAASDNEKISAQTEKIQENIQLSEPEQKAETFKRLLENSDQRLSKEGTGIDEDKLAGQKRKTGNNITKSSNSNSKIDENEQSHEDKLDDDSVQQEKGDTQTSDKIKEEKDEPTSVKNEKTESKSTLLEEKKTEVKQSFFEKETDIKQPAVVNEKEDDEETSVNNEKTKGENSSFKDEKTEDGQTVIRNFEEAERSSQENKETEANEPVVVNEKEEDEETTVENEDDKQTSVNNEKTKSENSSFKDTKTEDERTFIENAEEEAKVISQEIKETEANEPVVVNEKDEETSVENEDDEQAPVNNEKTKSENSSFKDTKTEDEQNFIKNAEEEAKGTSQENKEAEAKQIAVVNKVEDEETSVENEDDDQTSVENEDEQAPVNNEKTKSENSSFKDEKTEDEQTFIKNAEEKAKGTSQKNKETEAKQPTALKKDKKEEVEGEEDEEEEDEGEDDGEEEDEGEDDGEEDDEQRSLEDEENKDEQTVVEKEEKEAKQSLADNEKETKLTSMKNKVKDAKPSSNEANKTSVENGEEEVKQFLLKDEEGKRSSLGAEEKEIAGKQTSFENKEKDIQQPSDKDGSSTLPVVIAVDHSLNIKHNKSKPLVPVSKDEDDEKSSVQGKEKNAEQPPVTTVMDKIVDSPNSSATASVETGFESITIGNGQENSSESGNKKALHSNKTDENNGKSSIKDESENAEQHSVKTERDSIAAGSVNDATKALDMPSDSEVGKSANEYRKEKSEESPAKTSSVNVAADSIAKVFSKTDEDVDKVSVKDSTENAESGSSAISDNTAVNDNQENSLETGDKVILASNSGTESEDNSLVEHKEEDNVDSSASAIKSNDTVDSSKTANDATKASTSDASTSKELFQDSVANHKVLANEDDKAEDIANDEPTQKESHEKETENNLLSAYQDHGISNQTREINQNNIVDVELIKNGDSQKAVENTIIDTVVLKSNLKSDPVDDTDAKETSNKKRETSAIEKMFGKFDEINQISQKFETKENSEVVKTGDKQGNNAGDKNLINYAGGIKSIDVDAHLLMKILVKI